jgi:hypothetical protein
MNIEQLLAQATVNNKVDVKLYTNLVLLEAARLIKDTPITCAYTTFDLEVAKSQRADCFRQVYNLITENISNA